MAWFIIIVLMVVLWVASLCKILQASFSPSKASFLNSAGETKRNVLLVVAHPDDESMFFTPTINYLTSRGHNIHILCMSTGNADGMGDIRKEELYQASAILKVPLQQVKILDHPDLQDGFGKVWNCNLLTRIIEEEIHTHAIDVIITFDNYGVSGHWNHCDVNRGVRKLLHDTSQRSIEAWELVSTNILRKYNGPVDIWLSMLYTMKFPSGQMHCLVNERPYKSYVAMAQHRSQWVWYVPLTLPFVEWKSRRKETISYPTYVSYNLMGEEGKRMLPSVFPSYTKQRKINQSFHFSFLALPSLHFSILPNGGIQNRREKKWTKNTV